MNAAPAARPSPASAVYEICVQGHLGGDWADWFDGFEIECCRHGVTRLRGPLADQAALYGLLHRLRDLGLPLISVARVD
jgi:hypothetical protein